MITTETVTRWRSWTLPGKPHLYLDHASGVGHTSDGADVRLPPDLPLRGIAEAVPQGTSLVYLCGLLPSDVQDSYGHSPFNSWAHASDVDPDRGERLYLDTGKDHDAFMARLIRQDGGVVEVRTLAAWVGTNDATPAEAERTLALVRNALRRQYGWNSASLLKTPAGTGLELWHTSIPASQASGYSKSTGYPLLDEDLRTLIQANEGQGRVEYLPAPRSSRLANDLLVLDMRLAYGAPALGDIGSAPATHDKGSDYAGYRPARYRIRFTVPRDWAHVGLFMVKTDRAQPRLWHWPRTPEATYETWADASEMRVVLGPCAATCAECDAAFMRNDGVRCQLHGWDVQILERILYTPGQPLRDFAKRLVDAREEGAWDEDEHVRTLARAAIRNILLHGIGAFHNGGGRRPVTRRSGSLEDVPERVPFTSIETDDGEEYAWRESSPSPRFRDYDRPEWSSQVWGRTRARLLLYRDPLTKQYTGALTLPFETINAFRNDSIIVTEDPHWPDSGKPGALRVKERLHTRRWLSGEDDLAKVKKHEGEVLA